MEGRLAASSEERAMSTETMTSTRPRQDEPAWGASIEALTPPMPEVDEASETASTQFSRYRTKLSTRRTGLSEHRTKLSEHRTSLSESRTAMSFERTRMSADRTLMSIIRTSLSLISFGFTIHKVFTTLHQSGVIGRMGTAGGFFGQWLLCLGLFLLAGGIVYHLGFMVQLRRKQRAMTAAGGGQDERPFPISLTLIVALWLMLLGVLTTAGAVFHTGPFA